MAQSTPVSLITLFRQITGVMLLNLVWFAGAVEADDRGLLDVLNAPSQHTAGAGQSASPQQPPVAELKQERKDLLQLNHQTLQNKAQLGDRSAQLVLAERFAAEAKTLAFAPIAANSAMSDAAYWYTKAASRGFPGAARVDRTFPTFPLRAVRDNTPPKR